MEDTPVLDKIDRAILDVLAHDGRISMTELGVRVGLSKTPVSARVRRLEANGVITGYRAELSPVRLGLAHIAFLEIRLSDTRGTNGKKSRRKAEKNEDRKTIHHRGRWRLWRNRIYQDIVGNP